MENKKIKMTGTERLYLGWHYSYGVLLVLSLIVSLLGVMNLGASFAYGLIPQGIFQVILGMVAVLRPAEFRLKKS